ncbi:MAG TPA: MlaD family protein [Terriglobales bacterium]|nr:MlaD family protein [Terriglobales bacterium]
MASQKQLRWSELRVGLTVIFASIVLIILIFLMTGSTGLFTRKITLYSYFDNASGLRVGAPVRLEGVDIGNVKAIRVVAGRGLTPVQVVMTLSTRFKDAVRTDSTAELSTQGVLGETFVDIDSRVAHGPPAQDGAVLPIHERPDLQDMVRASQTTLQNIQALLGRVDNIVSFVQSGQGSVGKLIYDEALYKRLNSTLAEFQKVATAVTQGQGSLGKLIVNDDIYNRLNASVDKLNAILDQVNSGQGTIGKFLKDPAIYDNANQTIAKANQLMADVNAGKGAVGLALKDQAFAAKVNDTVNKLNALATQLNSGQGTAGKLLHDPSMYDNTNRLLTESRDLIAAIRKNPKKYLTIRLKIF